MASEVLSLAGAGPRKASLAASLRMRPPLLPGRIRLTSRQSISPWRVTRRVLRHRSEQHATRRSSRRHRRSTVCTVVPHPSTTLPPRKTARSDALTIEMSVLEARPPTAPESWLLSGISSPPLGSKPPHLTPNIPGGISEGLRTGHRPGTDPLPVGQCLDPSQTGPHTHHASADLTPGSGADSTHWSLLHSPAGGDEFARLILKAYKVVTTTESSVDD